MVNVEVITLEDGLEYNIVDEIVIEDIKYIYLVEANTNKVELRKLDDDENLLQVDDIKEQEKALVVFAKKHKNDLA